MPFIPQNKLANQIVYSCEKFGITTVVVSPGSRNAPLIIGFNASKKIESLSVVDERCAGFFALGIAQQTLKPVALVCTSGSALLNYYPAISEAFYSHIPLVIISADRPDYLIDVGDGQTIRQKNVFENHCLYNANLGAENDIFQIENALKIAIQQKGPVHINAPFDEPLYATIEATDIEGVNTENLFSIEVPEIPLNVDGLQEFANLWNSSSKKMVLVGSHFPDDLLQIQLDHFLKDSSVLVLTENTANVHNSKFINCIDKLIFPFDDDELEKFRPDILISLGGLIVSKKIKEQLRKFQPKQHWHIDSLRAFDTFHCLTHHFKISPQLFFSQFFFLTKKNESNYQNYWLAKKEIRIKKHQHFLDECAFSDLKVFESLLKNIPKNWQLQLGNSSVIRYAQLFDIEKSLKIFCNRGTSGIDGSTSTAIGAAYTSKDPVVFITGDISFFYDSNALWNNYIPSNFRIIVVNNGGGGIFRFISGPKNSNALDYFETPHSLTAEHLCKMFNFEYVSVDNLENLNKQLSSFYQISTTPKLVEIFTPREDNDKILKAYFSNLK
ncbi:2-succinyl-5-enolpyruvyl-6-hydroxy-3-cyclohexene-1-carboxylic-acid synthase [Lutibacter sp.]|uniref:2-succinyl-5-enolpyruvyl-6-hydroxy-3- cyclohexene-1-carboxylic-acid synthase n=1 Tax=Lutibacter sp. TaxID=1925666 RepID=UPI002734502D|nr:2-succinyl-5-enolpyruvyl-6-hydroxy-3-cyclohexene-1-carboxylic-acid synthase [Lutibacter sp.]MDP3312495.1 2-succinyl-5-enolpyruvyl-6-hydroxy-3-cyclohexene-1-carboxylic-acid synthase [Lutibacter sp.]